MPSDLPSTQDHLRRYLRDGRDAVLWKLEGLDEYAVRRPLTPTGTNLLGLVKHLACVEACYFGDTFGRPFPEPMPWWSSSAEPNADMWATADESRDGLVALYRRVQEHADTTMDELEPDSVGRVPHWDPSDNEVTLGHMMVRVATETHRHAGHADILRETVDGEAGYLRRNDNLPSHEAGWWEGYRARLEEVAESFR
jgi:hypothetical protein